MVFPYFGKLPASGVGETAMVPRGVMRKLPPSVKTKPFSLSAVTRRVLSTATRLSKRSMGRRTRNDGKWEQPARGGWPTPPQVGVPAVTAQSTTQPWLLTQRRAPYPAPIQHVATRMPWFPDNVFNWGLLYARRNLGETVLSGLTASSKYRPDIDGLRAVAVLAVVLYHAGLPGFTGGFVGVDIFFVISGFLITEIIIKDVSAGTFSFAGFYVRRARRILPAYVVVTVATIIIGLIVLPPAELTSLFESAAASALFVANVYFAGQMSYFQDAAEQLPLLHLWSLSVEEQFYVVWPLVALVTLSRIPKRWLAPLLLVGSLVALAGTEWALRTKSTTMVFFLSPFRAWELMLGALLSVSPVFHLRSAAARALVAAVAAACIIGSVGFYQPNAPLFPGLAAVPPCLGAALAIVLGRQVERNALTRILSSEILRAIGLISYSLYLWHWPIFAYCRVILGSPMSPTVAGIAVVASFVFAILSWRFIEQPFRRGYNRSKAPILGGAALALIMLFTAGTTGALFAGLPQRATAETLAIELALDLSKIAVHCLRERDPKAVERQFEGCVWGDGRPTELVWGDLHAAAYFVGMEQRHEATGEVIEFSGMQSCDPLWTLDGKPPTGRAEAACDLFNRTVINRVASDPAIRRVLINGFWSSRVIDLGSTRGTDLPKVREKDLDDFERDARRVVDLITAAGKDVVLLGEPPAFPTGGGACVKQQSFLGLAWANCDAARVWVDGVAGRINAALSKLATRPGVSFVDPVPVFCGETSCAPYIGHEVVYRDRHHMNDAGSKRVTIRMLVTQFD